jgi:tetratricopeptide (TPR) repeat protein
VDSEENRMMEHQDTTPEYCQFLDPADGILIPSRDTSWKESFWAGSIVFAFVAGGLFGGPVAHILASPWQEWAVDSIHVYDRPLLTSWLADACRILVPSNLLAALNILNWLIGALCCALIASYTTNVSAGRASRIERILGGCFAGLAFAATGVWSSVMEGVAPATLTVALTVAAFIVIHRPEKTPSLAAIFFCALFVGLATANDPAIGVIALILAILAIHAAAERASAWAIVSTYSVGFAAGAGVPILAALSRGEGRSGFLIHALATPYPTVGDGKPEFGYLVQLTGQFAWPILLLALAGLLLALAQGRSRLALGWSFVFLCMGPFLPWLTNQTRADGVITDTAAAQSLALASIGIFAAWGLVTWTKLLMPNDSQRYRRVAILLVAGLSLVTYQWTRLPENSDDSAEKLAIAILLDCPEESVLVTGDERIHSLVSTAQAHLGIRPDLTIVPADALASPRLRNRLARAAMPRLRIDTIFPPVDALERWAVERPQALAALNASPELRKDLRDLAVWELVRDNFPNRTFCFAGVSAPWLTARAQRNGAVLVFPRDGEIRDNSMGYIEEYLTDIEGEREESDLHQTLAALLVPASDAARRQGDLAEAARAAEFARQIGGDDALPWLASARAAARAGNRERAIAYFEQYLWHFLGNDPAGLLGETIQEDLTRNALAEAYVTSMGSDSSRGNLRMQEMLVSDLWAFEELQVLAEGYRMARERNIATRDIDALCEGAAVLTQLGDLSAARDDIGEAVSLDAVRVWRRLKSDPRFDLLRIETSAMESLSS